MLKIRCFTVCLLLFLFTSCASTIPSIYLQSADMTMDLHRPAYGITDLAVSRDGSLLMTGDNGGISMQQQGKNDMGSGTVRIWDLVQGRQAWSAVVPELQMIMTVAISPDNRYALTGGRPSGSRSGLIMWDLLTGERIQRLHPIRGEVFQALFSPDGKSILATNGTTLVIFDAESGRIKMVQKAGYTSGGFLFDTLPRRLVAAFTPDGRQIVTGGTDAALKLWDTETGQLVREFVGHERGKMGGISGISISSDGRYMFTSAVSDSNARLWELATGKEIRTFSGLNVFFLGAWGVAMTPDDTRGFITAQPLGFWDLSSGKMSTPLQLNQSRSMYVIQEKPGSAAFNPNGKTLLLSANDASVRIFDAETGREQALLVAFDNNEWIVITTEGYYNASDKGAEFLTSKLGGKDYTVESFYDVFYRPDIVSATLKGEGMRGLVTITMHDAVKNPPPSVEFTDVPSDTSLPKVKACYRVKSTGGGIGEVRFFHNAKLIRSDGYYRDMASAPVEVQKTAALNSASLYDTMRSIKVVGTAEAAPAASRSKGDVYEDCAEIEPVPGENEVSASAFNSSNTVQGYLKTAKFNSTVSPAEPHLYILAIGINQYRDSTANLKYAAKDAGDIGRKLLAVSATVYKQQNIHYELLADEKAGKAGILGKIDELSRRVKPGDGFILFVASHGVLVQNQYYMLTSDFDGRVEVSALISSNEIVEMSKKIRSLSQLYIFDTCHAGGVDSIVSGLYDARMSVLAKKMGLHIYASANSVQDALDGYQGNGLFTYTLLDGLSNKKEADKNNDNRISLVELGEYARQSTAELSKKTGHSQTPYIINFGKDGAIYILR